MIPLRDANPTRKTPVVTLLIIGLNVVLFLYETVLDTQGMLESFFQSWALIPAELTSQFLVESPTLFTAMFLHGGWAHLLGNMLYLWIFGDNIEDRLGPVRFVLFYLSAGLAASAAQIALSPDSQVPNIGASGAIAGVLGGYLLEFPRARVTTIVFRFITEVPAYIVLVFWFVYQLILGVTNFSLLEADVGGVAFWAHIGGFVAGLLLVRLFQVGAARSVRSY